MPRRHKSELFANMLHKPCSDYYETLYRFLQESVTNQSLHNILHLSFQK